MVITGDKNENNFAFTTVYFVYNCFIENLGNFRGNSDTIACGKSKTVKVLGIYDYNVSHARVIMWFCRWRDLVFSARV